MTVREKEKALIVNNEKKKGPNKRYGSYMMCKVRIATISKLFKLSLTFMVSMT